MPQPDGLGVAAQNFAATLQKIGELTEEKGERMMALFKALKKAKRSSIQVSGYKFEVSHTGPKDGIKVQKLKA